MANHAQSVSLKVFGAIVLLACVLTAFQLWKVWTPGPELGSRRNVHGATGEVERLDVKRRYSGDRKLPDSPAACRPFNQGASGRHCERWIVVTSIHPATDCLRTIASLEGWCMVVVADRKGPVSMEVANVDYVTVLQQERCGYRICRSTPWNHFGRKNIGYLYAIEHGAKWIYDTDDDNQPLAGKVPVLDDTGPRLRHVSLAADVWNPYPAFGSDAEIWPRGFPLSRITDEATKKTSVEGEADRGQLGVVQFLAQHDPDVDAIYRLTRKLPYDFSTEPRGLVVPSGTLSPYNAQATLHFSHAFWGLLLPITVHGRVSDIWRSYFTQRLLWDTGKHLAFFSPFVVQYRNPHNYLADFDSEMDLYYKTETLIKFLKEWAPADASASLEQRLLDMQIQLYEHGFVEAQDVELTVAWIQDLRCLQYTFPKVSPKP